MHQPAGTPAAGATSTWRARAAAALPWVLALLPWLILVDYLRLEWSANPQYGYGFVVPLLALYLAFQLWPTRPPATPLPRPARLLFAVVPLAALILPLLLLAEASPEWRLIGWYLALAAVGLTACLLLHRAGAPWLRHFAFPLLFMFVAVPWPFALEWKVTGTLMQIDAATAVEIVNWGGIPASQLGNVIALPNGLVGVDEACSGVRSLQTSLMIALFAGEYLGFDLLRRGLLLAAALKRLGPLSAPRPAASTPAVPTAPLRPWPLRTMLAIGLWLLAAEVATQVWFNLHDHEASRHTITWDVRWPTGESGYAPVDISADAAFSLGYSENQSSAAKWQSPDFSTLWLGYFLRWEPGRETSILATTHHPDICLPASGKKLVADDGMVLFPVAGLKLPAHVYQFDDAGRPLFVFFCVWTGGRGMDESITPSAQPGGGLAARLQHFLFPFSSDLSIRYRIAAIARGERNHGQQLLELGLWGSADFEDAKVRFNQELQKIVTIPP